MIKSYDHKILVIFMILFFSVFSAQDWNQPFINTDETLLLVEGMTKKQVLDEVGMPLLVHSGDDSTKTIKWIYEIRMIKVESKNQYKTNLYKLIQPRKSHSNYVHSQPIHRLVLEFRDNRLHNWKINNNYNVGSEERISNLYLAKKIITIFNRKMKIKNNNKLVKFVSDRPGHDKSYKIDSTKIRRQLNWKNKINLEQGLEETINWFINNKNWLKHTNKNYKGERLGTK